MTTRTTTRSLGSEKDKIHNVQYLNSNKKYSKKMEETEDINSWKYKIRAFIGECLRVLKVTKKPDAIEFKTIVKVSGLGILIIGLIGFVIQMVKLLFFG